MGLFRYFSLTQMDSHKLVTISVFVFFLNDKNVILSFKKYT